MKKSLSLLLSVVCLSLIVIGSLTSCDLFANSKFVFTDLGDSYEFTDIGESTATEIVVPSKYKGKPVTSIGKRAFYRSLWEDFYSDVEYPEITSIVLPDTITKIGDEAFAECTGLTSLVIPDSVTKIGERAFYYCTSLVSVNIPDGVTTIEAGTFSGCLELASISIPDSVHTIENGAFTNCTSLTSVTLPDSVTKISPYCFSGCSSLASFTISAQITAIGAYAFEKCTALTEMTIPNTVKVLGEKIFSETGKDLVVSVSYDEKPQEEWDEAWHAGMPGKAINTSEAYYNNVVVANQAKADQLQEQIAALLARYNQIKEVELPAIAARRNQAQASGNDSAYKSYQQEYRAKEEERNSVGKQKSELVEQLKKLPTTNQINVSTEADD